MKNIKDELIRTISSIKNGRIAKGETITEAEIAGKVGVSEEQLYAYLNGEQKIPGDFISRINSAFNLIITMVQFTDEKDFPDPLEEEIGADESNRKSLEACISIIKENGRANGETITEEDMANQIGISTEQIYAWLKGEVPTPADLTGRLLSAYQPLLDAVRMENNKEHLKRTVVWVRNLGLAAGRNIQLEEMAVKIGISTEQLYDCLNDQSIVEGDFANRLESGYLELFQREMSVEMKEDFYQIMERYSGGH